MLPPRAAIDINAFTSYLLDTADAVASEPLLLKNASHAPLQHCRVTSLALLVVNNSITSLSPEECDVSPSACRHVCMSLSARISRKPHVQTSRNFLRMLNVVVLWSSFDDNEIRYVLPVLWMTLCFHTLRGSASSVLTATGFVNGKGQFSIPHRIDTLNRSPNNLSQVITSATPKSVPN